MTINSNSRLVARTVFMEPDFDLTYFSGQDGVFWRHPDLTLAGRGQAARIELTKGLTDPQAIDTALAAVFESIDVFDDVGNMGCGPVAFGALPFLPHSAGHLIIPSLIAGKDSHGKAWLTTIGIPGEFPEVDRRQWRTAPPQPSPIRFVLSSPWRTTRGARS